MGRRFDDAQVGLMRNQVGDVVRKGIPELFCLFFLQKRTMGNILKIVLLEVQMVVILWIILFSAWK